MTTILLTGFEPFGGDASNPSGEAVHLVAAEWEGPETLVTAVLPVAFAAAGERMRELVAAHAPDLVIATGLASNRGEVTPERVAVNLADARIPDNDGAQPVDEPCVPGAPDAYFATLPVKAVSAAIAAAGIPSSVSYSAGTFVCNHVMFTARDAAPGIPAGFVHVPWDTASAPPGSPSLPLTDIARALTIAIRTALNPAPRAPLPGGSLS